MQYLNNVQNFTIWFQCIVLLIFPYSLYKVITMSNQIIFEEEGQRTKTSIDRIYYQYYRYSHCRYYFKYQLYYNSRNIFLQPLLLIGISFLLFCSLNCLLLLLLLLLQNFLSQPLLLAIKFFFYRYVLRIFSSRPLPWH